MAGAGWRANVARDRDMEMSPGERLRADRPADPPDALKVRARRRAARQFRKVVTYTGFSPPSPKRGGGNQNRAYSPHAFSARIANAVPAFER